MEHKITIDDFSPHLFWDVDKNAFDLQKYDAQLVSKVLEYGNFNDWKLVREFYGLDRVKQIVLNLRTMDDLTLHYLSTYFNVDKINFRCYTLRQSTPNYWNY